MSRKRISILDLQRKKSSGQPITMLTAYDFTGARLVDKAGIEVILVGE
jgi:3-methyl-2-oxobutanoate hydroxymethyltransferase